MNCPYCLLKMKNVSIKNKDFYHCEKCGAYIDVNDKRTEPIVGQREYLEISKSAPGGPISGPDWMTPISYKCKCCGVELDNSNRIPVSSHYCGGCYNYRMANGWKNAESRCIHRGW